MSGSADRSPPVSGDRSRWSLLLRALFWPTLLAVFILAVMPHPPQRPLEPSDKVQHFAAFLCLMLLGSAAYPRLSPVKLALGLAAFGALIEVIQAVPAVRRDADLLDWLVDVAAATCVLLALLVWRRLRAKA
jgi:hypothetical protein